MEFNKISFGKNGLKYLIGYEDCKKFWSCYVMLPKISVYRRSFDGTKYMSFLIKKW